VIFWTHVIGWTLVDFAWQGAAVGVIAAVAFRLIRHTSSATRYSVACVALAMMLISPLVTGLSLAKSVTPSDIARLQRVSFQAAGTVSPLPPSAVAPQPVLTTLRSDVERLLPMIVFLWLIGAAFLAVRLTVGWWRVRRLHKRALATPSSRLQHAGDVVAGRVGLRRLVHIVDFDAVDTPMALGWIRPVVLVPIAAVAQLTPTQVEAILAHELAHVRRWDYVVNLVQNIAEVFLFFHPVVWWLSARIRLEREQCCDDIAVELCGDPLGYVTALKQLEQARQIPHAVPPRLVFAATGGSLLKRVQRILRGKKDVQISSSGVVGPIALVTAFVIVLAGHSRLNAISQAPLNAAQPADQRGFASASIKQVVANTSNRGFLCAFGPGGRAFKAFGPVDSIVACAYGIPAARTQEQLIGGPDWLRVDLFEIDAQSPTDNPPTSFDDGLPMVRALLADRFRLAVHRETKHLDTLDLNVASGDGTLGPQMRQTPADCAGWIASKRKGPMPSRPGYRPCGFARTNNQTITNTAITMPQLANLLTAWTGTVVRDTTGLSGYFDVDLSPMPGRADSAAGRGRNLDVALRKQLGLTLKASTSVVDLLVVDHVERPRAESN